MLNRLRLQLTALYILVALSLVALTGLGAYYLVRYYLQRETDLALEYKMATEFRSYGLIPPPELVVAERNWLEFNARPSSASTQLPTFTVTPLPTYTNTPLPSSTPYPTSTPTPTSTPGSVPALVQPARPTSQSSGGEGEGEAGGQEDDGGGESASSGAPQGHASGTQARPTSQPLAPTAVSLPENSESGSSEGSGPGGDESYDSELASIYVLPLNASGQIISSPNLTKPPIPRNDQASLAAMVNGYDWRTVRNSDGIRVRLLTYRLSNPGGPAILQMGSTLAYQDRVLSQFLMGLLVLGAITLVLLGIGSWWLSGRSLRPAQNAWDQQQAFVSNASHELRTPLTLIRATAEVGLRGHPDAEQKEYLQGIVDETDYMNHLVDDLLLLSRLDTHRLQLAHEPVSLAELLVDTAGQAEKLGAEKGIHVEVGAVQGAVWGDRSRLRQVLLILLDNALRFSSPGSTISMETADQGEHPRMRQLIVTDHGSGISAEHLPHVFERFYQASSPGDPQARTNGLGLSIAKGLIEAQGGEIHIQSRVGEGTQVSIELPAADQ